MIVFFEKVFFIFIPWGGGGGCERFFRGRVCLILCNSKTTAPRMKILTSFDSETKISYLCLIHSAALTGLFFDLFLKSCFLLLKINNHWLFGYNHWLFVVDAEFRDDQACLLLVGIEIPLKFQRFLFCKQESISFAM